MSTLLIQILFLFTLPIIIYEWYLRTHLGDMDVQSIEAKEIRNKAVLKLFLSYGASVVFLFLWLLMSAVGENAGYQFLGIFIIAPAGAILISMWFIIRERIMLRNK